MQILHRHHARLFFALIPFLYLLGVSEVRADQCGRIQCENISGPQTNEMMQSLLTAVGSDCLSVETVLLLENTKPGIMVMYHVICDDGEGPQEYQVIHWVKSREFHISKYTGKWMNSINIHY